MLYSIVDNDDLFVKTVEMSTVTNWIISNTKRDVFNKIIHSPKPNDYALSLGFKSLQIITPPSQAPVRRCWKWINNTWKLNDDINTFPYDTVIALRIKEYKAKTDGLKLDADFTAAVANNVTPEPNPRILPDYTKWIAAKEVIRNNYPIPESLKTID